MQQRGVVGFAQKVDQVGRRTRRCSASASRRSGLKSVRPPLFTTTSIERARRWRVASSSPSPGLLTSPSTTSIFSLKKRAKSLP